MRRLLPALGFAVGLAVGLAGVALCTVGLMAMGAPTPKLEVLLLGVLFLGAAVGLASWSVLPIRRARANARAGAYRSIPRLDA